MKSRCPDLLYKYYSPERNVLKPLRVRFSQPAALNDPFEFALNVKPEGVRRAISKLGRQVVNPVSFVAMALQSAWRSRNHDRLRALPWPARYLFIAILVIVAPIFALSLLPFARRQVDRVTAAAGTGFERLLSSKGLGTFLVFSCSELWDSVPMWAHYAGNHTGFVIGIAPDLAFEHVNSKGIAIRSRPRRVEYVDSLPEIRFDKRGTDAIFSSKFKDWSYEKEWRFTAFADDAIERGRFSGDHEILLYRLEPDSVKEVIFGLNTSQSTIDAVIDSIEASGCRPSYYKVTLGDGYTFKRSKSLDVANSPEPMPVPSLVDMLANPAADLYEQFRADARQHRIMKKVID